MSVVCMHSTSTFGSRTAFRLFAKMHNSWLSRRESVSFSKPSDWGTLALPPPAYCSRPGRTRCRCESSTYSRVWTSEALHSCKRRIVPSPPLAPAQAATALGSCPILEARAQLVAVPSAPYPVPQPPAACPHAMLHIAPSAPRSWA
jgi:hypothetical protein